MPVKLYEAFFLKPSNNYSGIDSYSLGKYEYRIFTKLAIANKPCKRFIGY